MRPVVRSTVFPIAGTTRWGEQQDPTAYYSELRPVVDKPVIRFAIEEALRAGIVRFLFVTSAEKSMVEQQIREIWSRIAGGERNRRRGAADRGDFPAAA